MNPFNVKRSLESMIVYVDSREQKTTKSKRRYEDFKCKYERKKLEYGDYCFNFQYPNGKWAHDLDSENIFPTIYIERKMNLDELCNNFGTDRKRFQAEFQRAEDNKAKGYLLIENASWEHVLNGRYRSKLNKKSLLSSLLAWSIRYNFKIIFCKSESSGKVIYNILHRELKEYLENLEWEDGVLF